jgi:hypothetical protein
MERTKICRISKFKQKGIKFKQFLFPVQAPHFSQKLFVMLCPAQCKAFLLKFASETQKLR